MYHLKKDDFFWGDRQTTRSPLYEIFVGGIREIYWSENQLVRTLLKLGNATHNMDLRRLLDVQADYAKHQSNRLEQVLELLDEPIEARRCEAVYGLCKESNEILEYTEEGTLTRDAGIILITERIVQYEISSYEGLMKLAGIIERQDIEQIFAESLNEEQLCKEMLSALTEDTLQKAHMAA